MWNLAVLVAGFGSQNVTSVPSPLESGRCQMGQVRGNGVDPKDRAAHLKKRMRKQQAKQSAAARVK